MQINKRNRMFAAAVVVMTLLLSAGCSSADDFMGDQRHVAIKPKPVVALPETGPLNGVVRHGRSVDDYSARGRHKFTYTCAPGLNTAYLPFLKERDYQGTQLHYTQVDGYDPKDQINQGAVIVRFNGNLDAFSGKVVSVILKSFSERYAQQYQTNDAVVNLTPQMVKRGVRFNTFDFIGRDKSFIDGLRFCVKP